MSSNPVQPYAVIDEVKFKLNISLSDTSQDDQITVATNDSNNYIAEQTVVHAAIVTAGDDPSLSSMANNLAAAYFNFWISTEKDKEEIERWQDRIQQYILAKYGLKSANMLSGDETFGFTSGFASPSSTTTGSSDCNCTGSNLGAGQGVFAQKSGNTLQFKSLVAGTNVTLSSDGNEITINSTGGGGGSQTPWLSDIDADTFNLDDLGSVDFDNPSGTNPTLSAFDSNSESTLILGSNFQISSGYAEFVQISEPGTVPATRGRLYVRDDSGTPTLFFKEGTTETLVSGITSINGDSTAAQTIAAGTGLGIVDAGDIHTLSIDSTVATSSDDLSFFAATTSAQLAGVITDETGTGFLVFGTSPILVTPNLGTPSSVVLSNATALPVSGLADGTDGELITWDAAGVAATVATGTASQVLTSNGPGAAPTFQTSAVSGITSINGNSTAAQLITGVTDQIVIDSISTPGTTNISLGSLVALSTNDLSFFAATTSAELASIITNETGTGLLVFGTSPTLVTPTIASFTNAVHSHVDAAGGGQLTATLALDATGVKDATTFLRGDNTWAVPAGAGDVSGPGSSTDTALVRWNGVSGTLIQDSGILIDSSDNVTEVKSITFSSTGGKPFIQAEDFAEPTLDIMGDFHIHPEADQTSLFAIIGEHTVTTTPPTLTAIAEFDFNDLNSAVTPEEITYVRFTAEVVNSTDGIEEGRMRFSVVNASALTDYIILNEETTQMDIGFLRPAHFLDYTEFNEVGTPTNPVADRGRFFAKATATPDIAAPFWIDFNGDEFDLREGTIAFPINFPEIDNGNATAIQDVEFGIAERHSQEFTLTQNTTLTFSGTTADTTEYMNLFIIQDVTGGHTLTLPAGTVNKVAVEAAINLSSDAQTGLVIRFSFGVFYAFVENDPTASSQTPWASNIDADGFDLQDLSNIEFRETTGAPVAGTPAIWHTSGELVFDTTVNDLYRWQVNGVTQMFLDGSLSELNLNGNDIVNLVNLEFSTSSITISDQSNDMIFDVPSTKSFSFDIDGTPEYTFDGAQADFNANDLFDVGLITLQNSKTISSSSIAIEVNDRIDFTEFTGTNYVGATGNGEISLQGQTSVQLSINGAFIVTTTNGLVDISVSDLQLDSNQSLILDSGVNAQTITGDVDGITLNVPTNDSFDFTINSVSEYLFSSVSLDMNNNILLMGTGEIQFASIDTTISDQSNDMIFDVGLGEFFSFDIGGGPEYTFSDTQADFNSNNITDLGFIDFGAASADAGTIRLPNLATIEWEAAPAGTNLTIYANATEQMVVGEGSTTVILPANSIILKNNSTAQLQLEADHSSPGGQDIGRIQFIDDDSGGARKVYGQITTVVESSGPGEDGSMFLSAVNDGVVTDYISINVANDDQIDFNGKDIANVPQILDSNSNELLIFTTTASAVNEITLVNAATATPVELQATGGDADVDVQFTAKGTGTFYGNRETWGWPLTDETTAPTTGIKYTTEPAPYDMAIEDAVAGLTVAGTTDTFSIDVLKEDSVNADTFTTIFSTLVTIDATEFTSTTAAAAPVISVGTWEKGRRLQLSIDTLDTGGTARGVKIDLITHATAK